MESNELELFDETKHPLTAKTKLFFNDEELSFMIGRSQSFLEKHRWYGPPRTDIPVPRAIKKTGAVQYKARDIIDWYIAQ